MYPETYWKPYCLRRSKRHTLKFFRGLSIRLNYILKPYLKSFWGLETKQDPVGLLGTEDFLCPISWLQPPWPSLSSKGQIPTVVNPGRKGMQRQGRGSQQTIVQPWSRVLVLPQGIHITMSLGSLRCQYSSHHRKTTWGYIKGTREAYGEDHLRPD